MGERMIERTTLIEDLVREVPDSVGYMMQIGIKCLACGEPVWGTIESAANDKGFTENRITEIVHELNRLASKS
jgi:hypothetical protein